MKQPVWFLCTVTVLLSTLVTLPALAQWQQQQPYSDDCNQFSSNAQRLQCLQQQQQRQVQSNQASAAGGGGSAQVMNNPMYQGQGSEGVNPLYNGN